MKTIQFKVIYLPDSNEYYAKVKGWFFWHRFSIRSIPTGPSGPGFINITEYFSSIEEAKTCIKNYYEQAYHKKIQKKNQKKMQLEHPFKISIYEDGSSYIKAQ